MAKCPFCGTEVPEPRHQWTMKSPKSKVAFNVKVYLCYKCGRSFRVAEPVRNH